MGGRVEGDRGRVPILRERRHGRHGIGRTGEAGEVRHGIRSELELDVAVARVVRAQLDGVALGPATDVGHIPAMRRAADVEVGGIEPDDGLAEDQAEPEGGRPRWIRHERRQCCHGRRIGVVRRPCRRGDSGGDALTELREGRIERIPRTCGGVHVPVAGDVVEGLGVAENRVVIDGLAERVEAVPLQLPGEQAIQRVASGRARLALLEVPEQRDPDGPVVEIHGMAAAHDVPLEVLPCRRLARGVVA